MDKNRIDDDKRITKKCTVCGVFFIIPKCRDWREHECSSDCKNKKRLIIKLKRERSCLVCNKKFFPRKIQIENGGGKFCSMYCLHQSNIGNINSQETKDKRVKSFINSDYNRNRPKGENHPQYMDVIFRDGYRWAINEQGNKMQEHRLIIEKHIGRKLKSHEIVHHKDRNKVNNELDNLQIMTRSEHAKEHANEKFKAK